MLCSRATALRLAVTTGLLASLCGNVCTQQAAKRRPHVTALLRDPSGAPVANAKGWLRAEPIWQLACVAQDELPLLALASATASEHTATSNERGVLRFADESNDRMAAGMGMVTTKAGLGALLPRMHAGRPNRITLQPLAEVTTPTGSEPFILLARATLPDGSSISLPPLKGTKVRLPAGNYEVWVGTADGLLWQHLPLKAAERYELKLAGAAQRIQLATDAHVHPLGHPAITLRQLIVGQLADQPNQIALRGPARTAPLVTWLNGIVTPPRAALATTNTQDAIPWPPTEDRLELTTTFQLPKDAPPKTCLLGMVRKDDGSFRITAYAHNEASQLRMPACPSGDSWLLLVAKDRAPLALPWSTTANGSTLHSPHGQAFAVTAQSHGSLPAVDLAVSYTSNRQDVATLVARTDAFGVAHFGPVTAPGQLRVSDARFENQDIDLELIPSTPLPLVVQVGESLTATATFDDESAEGSIIVTLRDPLALLRPAQRTLVARPGEPFTFRGLPNNHNLVLFASAQRDGKAWSGRQVIHARDEGINIVLHNEDPDLRRRR